jgi:Domain of unknown function (DUF4956)
VTTFALDAREIPPGLLAAGASLGVALVCGLAISLLYRRTYRGVSYSAGFDRALVTLALITTIVIMVVGDNLARAFGLVGTMSIVRFRTALKDPQDLVFVFFSLTVGLAAGVGLHALALSGTLLIGLVILVLSRTNHGAPDRRELVLQLSIAEDGPRDPASVYAPVLDRITSGYRLLASRATGPGALDLTFHVTLADGGRASELTRALAGLPSVASVNVFHDEEP